MGCVMSVCGCLTTTKLASDDEGENHYGKRRANCKLGVVDIAKECELARERPGRISDNGSEIDQTFRSLDCDARLSCAEAAGNVQAGDMSDEQMTQRATRKRKREVCSAQFKKDEEPRALRFRSTKRVSNLGAILFAILSHGRRHSSTRIDVTRNSHLDARLQVADHWPVIDRAHTTAPVTGQPYSRVTEMVKPSGHSPNCESHPTGGQLEMSRSTPTIRLDNDQQAARSNLADEVSLFTSMNQLCYEIINRKLIKSGQRGDSCLCLFVFGRPGSSRGELAFELVEHSSLIDFIALIEENSHPRTQQSETNHNQECPLYHYLDVSSLIVANIDARIREYNRLVAQTLRSRRQRLASGETSSLESQASNKSQEETRDEIASENISESSSVDLSKWSRDDEKEEESGATNSRDFHSTGSELSRAKSKELRSCEIDRQQYNEQSQPDPFMLITLTTKQRSILQLKMIKYACCVTAKWVIHLLRREIGLLEGRLARATSGKHAPPRRVYLVNLVPNQLSLFKTCLYLQQSLPLGQLRMPHWAVKFERRTNIKLMINKERATALAGSTASETASQLHHSITLANPKGKKVLIQFKRLSQIRLPSILAAGAPATHNTPNKDIDTCISQSDENTGKNIESVAANLLANGPNEKLGPKYNDLFAQQFDSLNKLVRLRYNPKRNYNYSDDHDRLLPDSEVRGSPPPSPPSPTTGGDSCYHKLSYMIDFEHLPGPANSASLSQVSSLADDCQLMGVAGDSGHHPSSLHAQVPPPEPGRFLVSPVSSPCPSSVASDESLAFSYDFSGQHQRQQHSPAYGVGHCRLSPNASIQQQTGSCSLKWAVELELIDEKLCDSIKWHQQNRSICSDTQTGLGQANQTEALITDCCLHVYHNDKRPIRSRSYASHLTPSSLASAPETICQTENYYLVATRVAYATGKSQPVLEVKRLHRRVTKCSGSGADLIKLRKLISKACVCLTRDLDTWLRESIFARPESPACISFHRHHAAKTIALITYTIRVDVSKFVGPPSHARETLAEHEQFNTRPEVPRLTLDTPHFLNGPHGEHLEPSPSSDPIVQLLRTQPKRSNLAKPRASSARPLSANLGANQQEARVMAPDGLSLQLLGDSLHSGRQCDSSTHSCSPRQRHVQFKLSRAPLSAGGQAPGDNSRVCDAQRRLWLRDNLFASSNELRLLPIMDSLVTALKSIVNE